MAARLTEPVVRLDVTGRAAVVTGGASGIGLACARRLSEAGADVTVLDLNADAANTVAAEIGGRPWKAVGRRGDQNWPDLGAIDEVVQCASNAVRKLKRHKVAGRRSGVPLARLVERDDAADGLSSSMLSGFPN